jgi:uncharacterized protein (TIGR03435 family)
VKAYFHYAAVALVVSLCAPILAQSSDQFEVVSVKHSAPATRLAARLDRAQFVCTGCNLMILLASAYPDIEAQPWKVEAQLSWLRSEYWDIIANLPPDMPADQESFNRKTEQMLRTFLTEAFKLKLRRETKDRPIYALISAKSGPKLKSSEGSELSVKRLKDGFEFRHASMADLVRYLYSPFEFRQAAERPVVDMTGLKGFYDLTLEWTPETAQTVAPDAAPSIYRAVEDLGLKLQPQTAPLESVAIDHAERPEVN